MKSDPWYNEMQVSSTLERLLCNLAAIFKAVVTSIFLPWIGRFFRYCFPIKPECEGNIDSDTDSLDSVGGASRPSPSVSSEWWGAGMMRKG